MKSKALALFATVSGLGIFGCTAIPQAGLIYSSTNVIGVGMKVSAAGADSPVDISIGFKSHDFAYVPVAVGEGKTSANGQVVEISNVHNVWASHTHADGGSARCTEVAVRYKDAASRKQTTPQLKRELDDACDNKRDALSVYGQFDSKTDASGKERAANLAVGRVFSTGIAAQNVSHAARMIAHTDCVKAIRSVFPATGKEAEALAAITVNCPLD